ncbi:hypothetical protein [Pseudomonas fulva]|uniref:hypothetical protein n=1 Tax=Pseudomonas fulva TaxID=47880 RepID=UPI0018AAD920|nr:hypothetical protein [Pseudomonas fulva]MBF8679882.1 hypothetical protein [Pseudomonas fulva]MBF8717619.1 hypothetical protein [Pseudomonas fulva]MBF8784685.1 hypothetical protein [Pseudomonas fulva]
MTALNLLHAGFAELQPGLSKLDPAKALPDTEGALLPVVIPSELYPLTSRTTTIRFATLESNAVEHQILINYISMRAYRHKREDTMKSLLQYEVRDVPVMLGSATFAGSLLDVAWKLIASAPAPSGLIILTAVAGLAGGRVLAFKARRSE